MAVLHYAYSFDPSSFCERFRARCFSGDHFDVKLLQKWAESVPSTTSAATEEVLMALRYDSEWLYPPTGEKAQPELWFILALVENLEQVSSLSHRRRSNYYVLKLVLPIFGWTETEVDRLLLGDGINTLAQSIDPLIYTHLPHLSSYRGWLDPSPIEEFLSWFDSNRTRFETPEVRAIKVLEDHAKTIKTPATDILVAAYADAVDMLTTAQDRQAALLMIID